MEELSPNLTKEERRAEKLKLSAAEERRRSLKKLVKKTAYWIIGLATVLGGGWLLVSVTGPKGPDYSQAIPVLGRNHIADGSITSYNSNPPTSGDHYAQPAHARFYSEELPDEQVVHNLEHVHVWISYKPDLSPEVIKILRDFAGGNNIVTPRSANDFDIALAAWGRLDKFNLENGQINEQRIKDFISRYQNRGPENVDRPSHLR